MYLIEIEVGREQLYESPEALGSAIRRGVVGPESRIFHRASGNWVSITMHPEYKKVMADLASEPLPPLARTRWTFFGLEPSGREFDDHDPADGQDAAPATAAERPRGWRGLLRRVFRSPTTA